MTDKPINKITQVKMKDGSIMNHIKDNDDRHIFFGNLTAMSRWTIAILIFILLTSILMNYFTATLVQDSNNIIMAKLNKMDGTFDLESSGQSIEFMEVEGLDGS